ncbi:MAG: P-type conjugative transfer protein VirB9 [Hyphomicrobiales bacterium]|nr:P-type conjugative transfer protein VirB9 [Hyphomicrobiales bacterium]
MKRTLLFTCLAILSAAILPQEGKALQESKSVATDSRIRNYVYRPNEVYIYRGHYRYASSIEFSPDESIQTVTMGDSTGWQIINQGSRLFLKPIEYNADTNMTVYTNKRIYHFELYAEEADNIRDDKLVFIARFFYPNDDDKLYNGMLKRQHYHKPPDIEAFPEKYNFNYSISGSDIIAPRRIFDDGEFTYFEFDEKNPDIPAFFHVNPDGSEALINFRVNNQYIVVERVSSQFTLRWGSEVACVFNENLPMRPDLSPKRKLFGVF